ncbi:hypothetical protein [Arthrobacter sp. AQ5-05]|uniref:hypothetical protein n=1 Tax=Arthrobacter sp. AQ5-05 TaxID=2184581 RepID=UPI0012B59814|nr:hypothetical protein [Arthrobacter sp. AQ5-05]
MPFHPLEFTLPAGSGVHSVASTDRHANIFNPGGFLPPKSYRDKTGTRLSVGRELSLASFLRLGLKPLKIEQTQLIDTPPIT